VQLALNKEALFEQRLQPRWPPVVLVIRASRTLLKKNENLNETQKAEE